MDFRGRPPRALSPIGNTGQNRPPPQSKHNSGLANTTDKKGEGKDIADPFPGRNRGPIEDVLHTKEAFIRGPGNQSHRRHSMPADNNPSSRKKPMDNSQGHVKGPRHMIDPKLPMDNSQDHIKDPRHIIDPRPPMQDKKLPLHGSRPKQMIDTTLPVQAAVRTPNTRTVVPEHHHMQGPPMGPMPEDVAGPSFAEILLHEELLQAAGLLGPETIPTGPLSRRKKEPSNLLRPKHEQRAHIQLTSEEAAILQHHFGMDGAMLRPMEADVPVPMNVHVIDNPYLLQDMAEKQRMMQMQVYEAAPPDKNFKFDTSSSKKFVKKANPDEEHAASVEQVEKLLPKKENINPELMKKFDYVKKMSQKYGIGPPIATPDEKDKEHKARAKEVNDDAATNTVDSQEVKSKEDAASNKGDTEKTNAKNVVPRKDTDLKKESMVQGISNDDKSRLMKSHDDLIHEKDVAMALVNQLAGDLNECSYRISSDEKLIQGLQNGNEDLLDQLQQFRDERDDLLAKLTEMERELAGADEYIQTLDARMASSERKLLEDTAKMKHNQDIEGSYLNAKIREAEASENYYKEEIENLKERLSKAEADTLAWKSKAHAQEKENDKLRESELDTQSLQTKLHAMESEASAKKNIMEQLSENERHISALQERIMELEIMNKRLNDKASIDTKEANEKAVNLQTKLLKLQNEKGSAVELQSELNQREKDKSNREVNQQSVLDIDTQNMSQVQNLELIASLKQQTSDWELKQSLLVENINFLESENKKMEHLLEMSSSDDQQKTIIADNRELSLKVVQLEKKCRHLTDDKSKASTIMIDVKESFQRLQSKIQLLQMENDGLDQMKEGMSSEILIAEEEISNLQHKLHHQQKLDLSGVKREVESKTVQTVDIAEDETIPLQEKITELESALKKVTGSEAALTEALQSVEQQQSCADIQKPLISATESTRGTYAFQVINEKEEQKYLQLCEHMQILEDYIQRQVQAREESENRLNEISEKAQEYESTLSEAHEAYKVKQQQVDDLFKENQQLHVTIEQLNVMTLELRAGSNLSVQKVQRSVMHCKAIQVDAPGDWNDETKFVISASALYNANSDATVSSKEVMQQLDDAQNMYKPHAAELENIQKAHRNEIECMETGEDHYNQDIHTEEHQSTLSIQLMKSTRTELQDELHKSRRQLLEMEQKNRRLKTELKRQNAVVKELTSKKSSSDFSGGDASSSSDTQDDNQKLLVKVDVLMKEISDLSLQSTAGNKMSEQLDTLIEHIKALDRKLTSKDTEGKNIKQFIDHLRTRANEIGIAQGKLDDKGWMRKSMSQEINAFVQALRAASNDESSIYDVTTHLIKCLEVCHEMLRLDFSAENAKQVTDKLATAASTKDAIIVEMMDKMKGFVKLSQDNYAEYSKCENQNEAESLKEGMKNLQKQVSQAEDESKKLKLKIEEGVIGMKDLEVECEKLKAMASHKSQMLQFLYSTVMHEIVLDEITAKHIETLRERVLKERADKAECKLLQERCEKLQQERDKLKQESTKLRTELQKLKMTSEKDMKEHKERYSSEIHIAGQAVMKSRVVIEELQNTIDGMTEQLNGAQEECKSLREQQVHDTQRNGVIPDQFQVLSDTACDNNQKLKALINKFSSFVTSVEVSSTTQDVAKQLDTVLNELREVRTVQFSSTACCELFEKVSVLLDGVRFKGDTDVITKLDMIADQMNKIMSIYGSTGTAPKVCPVCHGSNRGLPVEQMISNATHEATTQDHKLKDIPEESTPEQKEDLKDLKELQLTVSSLESVVELLKEEKQALLTKCKRKVKGVRQEYQDAMIGSNSQISLLKKELTEVRNGLKVSEDKTNEEINEFARQFLKAKKRIRELERALDNSKCPSGHFDKEETKKSSDNLSIPPDGGFKSLEEAINRMDAIDGIGKQPE